MATLKFSLDTRSNGGLCLMRIRVAHKHETRYISTQVRIKPEQWDSHLCQIVNHTQARVLNSLLSSQFNELESKLLKLSLEGINVNALSCNDVKDLLLDKPLKSHLFLPALEAYRDSSGSDGTRRAYDTTIAKLALYLGDSVGSLTFEDITPAWLIDFDKWLASSMCVNSRSIQMRNIRAVFNRALDNDLITCYPFRKFKIKSEATRKRSLTIVQLREFLRGSYTPSQNEARDFFMLTFYLIGINTKDLLNLSEINVQGRIEYRRAKTAKLYSIKVEPEAAELIEKYKGVSHLLCFGDKYDSFDFCHNLAHRYRRIEGFSELSIYWARHTWATIAAELDIPKETIAAALGHGGNSVTDIYIRFDEKKIDAANRKVIDYLFAE